MLKALSLAGGSTLSLRSDWIQRVMAQSMVVSIDSSTIEQADGGGVVGTVTGRI